MSITIRNYQVSDWNAIQKIHDESRKIELKLAGLEDAFLPLCIAAERENLFDADWNMMEFGGDLWR